MEYMYERRGEARLPSHRGRGRGGRGRGSTRDRSPGQLRDMNCVRRRLDGRLEDLGSTFGSISEVMKREMETVVGNTPRDIQGPMKEGMRVMVKAVEEAMEKIVERDRREVGELKERERKRQLLLEKLEEKVMVLEKKAEVGSAQLEDRMKYLEERLDGGMEKVKVIREQVELVKGDMEMVSEVTQGIKVGESVKEMEEKVRGVSCTLKVVNMDLGQETGNKALIVRRVLEKVRRGVRHEEAGQLNRVLRRTRVVLLGNRTEGRKVGEMAI